MFLPHSSQPPESEAAALCVGQELSFLLLATCGQVERRLTFFGSLSGFASLIYSTCTNNHKYIFTKGKIKVHLQSTTEATSVNSFKEI
jgi:hypothetical protein